MKKNFKRFLCLALAAVMVMALAACGKKDESGEKDLLDHHPGGYKLPRAA